MRLKNLFFCWRQVDKESGGLKKKAEPSKAAPPAAKVIRDKPEKILGITKIQGELHFLVKYKNKVC